MLCDQPLLLQFAFRSKLCVILFVTKYVADIVSRLLGIRLALITVLLLIDPTD